MLYLELLCSIGKIVKKDVKDYKIVVRSHLSKGDQSNGKYVIALNLSEKFCVHS